MLTADYSNKIVHSDASISDMIVFHEQLRGLEASTFGILAPTIHTYKLVPLGGGSFFPAVAFINGWTLQFPAGNWFISGGNLSCTINPVAGAFVMQTQSAAYAVTSSGGNTTALTPELDARLLEVKSSADAGSALATWSKSIEGSYSAEDLLKLISAVLLGNTTGSKTNTVAFKDVNGVKSRVSATLDANGDRTAVIKDVL